MFHRGSPVHVIGRQVLSAWSIAIRPGLPSGCEARARAEAARIFSKAVGCEGISSMRSRTISRNIATSPCKLLNAICSLASMSPLPRMSSAKGSAVEPLAGSRPCSPAIRSPDPLPPELPKAKQIVCHASQIACRRDSPKGRGFAPKPVDQRGQGSDSVEQCLRTLQMTGSPVWVRLAV